MDAIRQRIIADLGEEDATYIRGIVKKQRQFEVAGRALMYLPPAWPLAVASLSISKILDNMEIGHNVMHGQYDWMGDPGLNSRMYEWDNVCPSDQWKYSHNYIHHTFTNILGKDRDIGYGILRMDEDQKWHPYYLGNPVYAFLLMTFFEWGVAMHDLEVENIVKGTRKLEDNKALHAGLMRKVRKQALKDYVLFPALTGPLFPLTFAGNAVANLVRNVWAFNIIFCGHFPAGAETFTEEECARTGVARALVLPPGARLGQHHRRQAVPHHERATCRTRSSTTCSPTCPHGATPRSPARSARSASATGWSTRPDRCASSSSASPGRSAAWPCPGQARRRPGAGRRAAGHPGRVSAGNCGDTGTMEADMRDKLSKAEIRKDAVQDGFTAATHAVGHRGHDRHRRGR